MRLTHMPPRTRTRCAGLARHEQRPSDITSTLGLSLHSGEEEFGEESKFFSFVIGC